MKYALLILTLLLNVWTVVLPPRALADGTPVVPASQAEVNAGTIHTKFVAPDTLKNWSGEPANAGTNVYYISYTHTNFSDDTNNLFVTGAGTAAANVQYRFKQLIFTNGWMFTNLTGTGFLCSDKGGNAIGSNAQNPYFMGPTTNNDNTAWYYSPISERFNWLNNNFFTGPMAGALPNPIVKYGTNQTAFTRTVIWSGSHQVACSNALIVEVDQLNGDDTGGALMQCPFQTLTAAKNFATNGWTIHVLAGTFNENNLLKNGVNWKFDSGTTLGFTDPITDTNSIGLFDERTCSGAVTSNIEADNIYLADICPAPACANIITNATSFVKIKANKFTFGLYELSTSSSTLSITAPGFLGIGSVLNCGYSSFDFDAILRFTNVVTNIDASESSPTYGQLIPYRPVAGGFYWQQGEMHIKSKYHDALNALQGFLWIDAAPTFNESWVYYEADRVDGYFYDTETNSALRASIKVKEQRHDIAGTSGSGAIVLFGSALIYYEAEKVAGGTLPFIVGNIATAKEQVWTTVQKLTAPQVIVSGGGASFQTYNRITTYQPSDPANAGVAPFVLGGGTNFVEGLNWLTLATTNTQIRVSGGKQYFQNWASPGLTNASPFAFINGGNLYFQNFSDLSSNFLSATNAQTVYFSQSTVSGTISNNITLIGYGITNGVLFPVLYTGNKVPTAVTLTGSAFTFTNNTPYSLECYFSGGTAYSVTKNGAGVYGSLVGDGYFVLQPTNRCVVTYTIAPTFYTNSL